MTKWIVAGVFGLIVGYGLVNAFSYSLERLKRLYHRKVEQYRQRHHLPGNRVHRPKRNKG